MKHTIEEKFARNGIHFYNMFHPLDPVAHRMDPLLLPPSENTLLAAKRVPRFPLEMAFDGTQQKLEVFPDWELEAMRLGVTVTSLALLLSVWRLIPSCVSPSF